MGFCPPWRMITRVPIQIPPLDPQTAHQVHHPPCAQPHRPLAHPHAHQVDEEKPEGYHHQGTKTRIHLDERQEVVIHSGGLLVRVTKLRAKTELRTFKRQLTTGTWISGFYYLTGSSSPALQLLRTLASVVTLRAFSFPRELRPIATWSRFGTMFRRSRLWNGREWDRDCPIRTLQREDAENVLGTGNFLRGVRLSPNPFLKSHKDGFHFHGYPPVSDMLECRLLR
jgi:hypothetical protein